MTRGRLATRVSSMSQIASEWRKGQIAFNFVDMVRPDIANSVRGDHKLDPFHRDENLDRFWKYCAEILKLEKERQK